MVDVGSIASAATDLTSTGLNLIFTQQQNQEARAWEEEQSRLAFNQDFYMWQQQNEYNSPEAQMQRLKAAGLNPHLMYGQGNVGNAQSMPHYQKAAGKFGLPNIQLPDVANIILDMQMKRVSIDKVREQVEVLKEQKDMARINNIATVLDTWYNSGGAGFYEYPERFQRVMEEQRDQMRQTGYYESHGGRSLNDYQLDAKKAIIDQYRANTGKIQSEKALKDQLAKVAEMKVESLQNEGYDRTTMDYMDDSMRDLFDSLGEGGAAASKFLLPILLNLGK